MQVAQRNTCTSPSSVLLLLHRPYSCVLMYHILAEEIDSPRGSLQCKNKVTSLILSSGGVCAFFVVANAD